MMGSYAQYKKSCLLENNMTNADFKNNEFNAMQEAWATYKKYYLGADPHDDDFWNNMVNDFLALNRKYRTDFCNKLTALFIEDIDARSAAEYKEAV